MYQVALEKIILSGKIALNLGFYQENERSEIVEHIVQFGVNIDDDAIRRTIENNIQKKVEGAILQDVKESITGSKNYTSWAYKDRIEKLISEATTQFLEDYKEEIIEKTSIKLVERLAKTKAVKEMVDSTINSLLSEK